MRRLPTVGDDENLRSESASWVAGVVPEAVARRGLSVEVRGPETVTLGEPARFYVAITNRLPVAVSVTLPTTRLWGWQIDGVPEADERGYEAPETSRTVAFARGGRKVFSTEWDGRVRRTGDSGDVWVDCEGRSRFTGYLAVEGWEDRGLYDEMDVFVG
jgi:hypothetical protein